MIVTLGHHATAPIIGDFMLRREDGWAQLDVADQAHATQAELGGILDPAYTGHGYATEAAGELLRYCFQDLGVRESLHRSGRWLDTVGYAVLQEEWLACAGTDRSIALTK